MFLFYSRYNIFFKPAYIKINMQLKKGEFVEIEYSAIDKETGKIFDLTSEETAKKEGIYNPNAKHGKIIICLGEGQILKGLDESLIGKEADKDYIIELLPEKGFGKRDNRMMKLVSIELFKKENIRPFPGLRINIDGILGTVRSVSGGRVIVDFNNPLAGHTVIYKIKMGDVIKDTQKKLESLLELYDANLKGIIKDNIAEINNKVSGKESKFLNEKIKKLIPEIKEVKFLDIEK